MIHRKNPEILCHMTSAEWKERIRSFSCFLRGPLALAMWRKVAAFLRWVMSPRALLHHKYAAIRAVARGTVNMQ